MDTNLSLTNAYNLSNSLSLNNPNELNKELTHQEEIMLNIFNELNLPTENILVKIQERGRVLKNIGDILLLLPSQSIKQSVYISKFLAAVCAGLFDAALNYLWDETVLQIRRKIIQYDLQYFYDLVISEEKRKNFTSEDDLVKVDDYDLIKGAKEIDLISDIGYRLLDHIRFMRNWASAAHPNQTKITGLNLADWLEICIKEVISLDIPKLTIEIKKLLVNIKKNTLTSVDIATICSFYKDLDVDRANSLCNGFWGIYCNTNTDNNTRNNIKLLLPKLWLIVNEETRYNLGIKYGRYKINNETEKGNLAREFLQIVNAESYIPNDLKVTELKIFLEYLHIAHNSFNNFYTEGQYAKQILSLIGNIGVPKQINKYYVHVIVEAFLTNGHGICLEASPIYEYLINNFDQEQMLIAITSFSNDTLSSKLQNHLCELQYRKLLELIKQKVTSLQLIDFIDKILKYNKPLCYLKEEKNIMKNVEILKQIIK